MPEIEEFMLMRLLLGLSAWKSQKNRSLSWILGIDILPAQLAGSEKLTSGRRPTANLFMFDP